MFKNCIGGLKGSACVLFVLGLIASVVFCIVSVIGEKALLGIIILFAGVFVTWLTSLLIYGFGELIENVVLIRDKLDSSLSAPTKSYKCPSCGKTISSNSGNCPSCGYNFSSTHKIISDSNDKFWYCESCGYKNDIVIRSCGNCGKNRD